MFPQKSFRLSGQGVGVQRRSFRGSGIVRLVFQRAHGVAPRESEALQGCCLGKRAPNARECAIQQQESPAVRQTIVKHTKETIEGVLPVTKYLSSQGKEIGRKGDSFFQKIGVILEQYFMSMLDEDTDRQAIAKVVQKDANVHIFPRSQDFFLLRLRGRGGFAKSDIGGGGWKSSATSLSSSRTRARARKERREISPLVSKRRTLARGTPDRFASSAWVIFRSSLRSLALFASSICTSWGV